MSCRLDRLLDFRLRDSSKAGREDGFGTEPWVARAILCGIMLAGLCYLLISSIHGWASFCTNQFTIDGTRLSIRIMQRVRSFDISEIRQVDWWSISVLSPFISILFHLSDARVRLYLSQYATDDPACMPILRVGDRQGLPNGLDWPERA
jgi:hypothetical protein